MWWFILICDLFIPIIMILAGIIMWKHAPKEINGLLGYRTTRSMKNMDTWQFAHDHCGRLWWKIGLVMLIATIPAHLPFYQSSDDTLSALSLIVTGVQLVVLIASVFPTEMALKKTFHDDGTRKVQATFEITENDVLEVYKRIKDVYPLVLTTTSALNAESDAGFTIDCPIIVFKAHEQILQLYAYEDDFVMDVMDNEQTKGTHWHPDTVESAIRHITDFMNGKSDYKMQPYKQD